MLFGWGWSRLPIRYRALIKPGQEFIWFIPLLFVAGWAFWQAGIALEAVAFTVPAPTTADPARRVADWWQWWHLHTGMTYDQRSSLVVGIMMGFAVIPIIFTISEDALANVPKNLRSASLALGGSRWQTAWRVVLPTASAGIFSALMIGLGRAIGETMIMVMATGNTPIIDWNPFDGMRTLAANIATELPEAAVGGTLYRTLFLCALLLFMMTFVINTIAELMRQHLREKYKTV
jgi:phosphate transport system permease protein